MPTITHQSTVDIRSMNAMGRVQTKWRSVNDRKMKFISYINYFRNVFYIHTEVNQKWSDRSLLALSNSDIAVRLVKSSD